VLQHIDVFLKACEEGKGKLDSSIGNLLLETFKGGPSVTLAVKEEHIKILMKLLLQNGTPSSPAILSALKELLVVIQTNTILLIIYIHDSI